MADYSFPVLIWLQYPLVPGHEVVGVVTATGSKVTKFKPGDMAAVGCMVDSCMSCKSCKRGDEQYCATGSTFTSCGTSAYGRAGPAGTVTKVRKTPAIMLPVLTVYRE